MTSNVYGLSPLISYVFMPTPLPFQSIQMMVLGTAARRMRFAVPFFSVLNVPRTWVGMPAASMTVVWRVSSGKSVEVMVHLTILPIAGSRNDVMPSVML